MTDRLTHEETKCRRYLDNLINLAESVNKYYDIKMAHAVGAAIEILRGQEPTDSIREAVMKIVNSMETVHGKGAWTNVQSKAVFQLFLDTLACLKRCEILRSKVI